MLKPAFDVAVSANHFDRVESIREERIRAGWMAEDADRYAEEVVQSSIWAQFYGRRMREANQCVSADEKRSLRDRWVTAYGEHITDRLLDVAKAPKARAHIASNW